MASYNRMRRRALERGKDLSKLTYGEKQHGHKPYDSEKTVFTPMPYNDPDRLPLPFLLLNPFKGGRI